MVLIAVAESVPVDHVDVSKVSLAGHRLRHHGHHGHSRKHKTAEFENIADINKLIPPELRSRLVVFSAHPPTYKPYSNDDDDDNTHLYDKALRIDRKLRRHRQRNSNREHTEGLKKNNTEQVASREKRQASSGKTPIPVCQTVSDWITKDTGFDKHDNQFTVLQHFTYNTSKGEHTFKQYIYEEWCIHDGRHTEVPCTGINRHLYTSVCRTKHVYAFAYVEMTQEDGSVERGWIPIRVNGGCECALFSRVWACFSKWRL